LKYDYCWKTEPARKPRVDTTTDTETETKLFRHEDGDEVFDFINTYSEENEILNKVDAFKIERLLRDHSKTKRCRAKKFVSGYVTTFGMSKPKCKG
jgi:hypothetical protein